MSSTWLPVLPSVGAGVSSDPGRDHFADRFFLDDTGQALGQEVEIFDLDRNTGCAPGEEIVLGFGHGLIAVGQDIVEFRHDRIH